MYSRQSGIELLKIIAVFLIVVCHTSISMTFAESGFSGEYWFFDLNSLPNSIEKISLTFYNYCGYIGNNIFFVCSAWFLLVSKRSKKVKILKMEMDVWTISVIYLLIFVLTKNMNLNFATVLQAVFPTTFNNNWFVTAYMLFYLIHPALNRILEVISRNSLKYGCMFFIALICIWMPFFQEWSKFQFYFSYPIMWILIYFCIAYLKKYHRDLIDSLKAGTVTLATGLVGLLGEILATYYFGSYSFIIGGDGMRWDTWHNPFLWLIAFGSFNVFRHLSFRSGFINRISSLSLLVYLIHENFLLRDNWRPYIYVMIHDYFYNEYVALWLLAFAAATFIVTIIIAYLYKNTLQRATSLLADKIYGNICRVLLPHENRNRRRIANKE